MMKDTVDKLYEFIARLVITIEDELNKLETKKIKNEITVKKNILDMLGRLVMIVIQLNKLSKEESWNSEVVMSGEDKQIIENFLEKYKNHYK